MGRRKWERMSSPKFKFVCLHTHAHTHGVKNSIAKGVLKPHCDNAHEYAKQESNENTALSLCLGDPRQKHQCSSKSFGPWQNKRPLPLLYWGQNICCQSRGKALSAFLPKGVKPMRWELCPFIPRLPAASGSWRKTLNNSSSAGRDDQSNIAHPWSAPSWSDTTGKEPLGWPWHKAREERCSRSPKPEDDTLSFK